MKKLFLILLAALMLCSCGVQEEPVYEEPEVFEESSSSEEEKAEWHPLVYERVDKSIFEYEFRYNPWAEELSERGISVSIENREFTAKEKWEAELLFENSEKELRIPFSGIYDFNGNIYYGTVLFPDEKTAVFCGNKKAVFFDTETLEPWDFVPEFPDYGKENIWINGAGINEKDDDIVLFVTPMDPFQTEEAVTSIIVFNENGITESGFTVLRGTASSGEKKIPFFFRNSTYFEYNGESFLRLGYENINLENGIVWEESGDVVTAENGSYRLEMAYTSPKQDIDLESGYLAILYKNGEAVNSIMFSEPDFCDPNYAGTEEKPVLLVKGDVATFRFPYFAMELTLDFKNQTHKLEYKPSEVNMSEDTDPIRSADGKYTVYSYGFNGAGDVVGYHVAVRENETGRHNYLGEIGGMYGGYNGLGFLKNNDIYHYTDTSLKIYDPKTLEVKFDINKNFPLGYDEESGLGRGISTFRRDPDDFSYILVYYEYDEFISWDYVNRENVGFEKGSVNYKIGFLDPEGNLLESYESPVPVASSPFGFESVDMRYSPEKLTVFVTSSRGGIPIYEFEFDPETKEFKVNLK